MTSSEMCRDGENDWGATMGSELGPGTVVFAALLGIYFTPLLVAILRDVPNVASVGVVNVLVGWTIIGWLIAFAMAVRSAPAADPRLGSPPGSA